MAETKNKKALRYIAERRLTVVFVADTGQWNAPIKATCRGDSGQVYQLGYRTDKHKWACTCEANAKFGRECSHLIALKLVTVQPA